MDLHTPVAFIIFNRPDLTKIIFEEIRKVKPKKLLIIADGPRHEDERKKCEQARAIVENVDWQCEVLKNYSDTNLGCKIRVSSGINWVFEQVEEAIILEDDCLPHPSFFDYCQTLLDRYRNDERIMQIAGVNFQDGITRGEGSYYFSKYSIIWGWATWKRAWKNYDVTITGWPDYKLSGQFKRWCLNKQEENFWENIMEMVYRQKIDTWDYQWLFAIMKTQGYCVIPNNNMITNIGFRSDATHTSEFNSQMAMQPGSVYLLPDKVAPVMINEDADSYTFHNIFDSSGSPEGYSSTERKKSVVLLKAIKQKLRSMFS